MINLVRLEANMTHQYAPIEEEWKQENLPPYDELILSWNATRPAQGKFLFYVSVKTNEWSPWILYASWGSYGQASYHTTDTENSVKVFQDALQVLERKKATGFRIKVATDGNADLSNIFALHVYTNGHQKTSPLSTDRSSIYLNVPKLSQMTLDHIRHKDLCSPTSTTAVVRYLSNNHAIEAVETSQKVWDSGFDIFGNWVFNVAQAASLLGPKWSCWVERLSEFDAIYQSLAQGNPVIVSVRGPLPGSALSYASGHLIVVIGFDSAKQQVICMDPAFPKDEETHVCYALKDFLEAWSRRGNIAYVFSRHVTDEPCEKDNPIH